MSEHVVVRTTATITCDLCELETQVSPTIEAARKQIKSRKWTVYEIAEVDGVGGPTERDLPRPHVTVCEKCHLRLRRIIDEQPTTKDKT